YRSRSAVPVMRRSSPRPSGAPGVPVRLYPACERGRLLGIEALAERTGRDLELRASLVDELQDGADAVGSLDELRGGRECLPQLGKIVVVAEPVGQIAERLFDVLHGFGPEGLQKLRAVAQVLGALSPLVKILVGSGRERAGLGLAALAIDRLKARRESVEPRLADRPGGDTPPQCGQLPADRRKRRPEAQGTE